MALSDALCYHILGVTDSSGIRFYYTSTPREHDAGIMFLGHSVTSLMIVPPGAPNYMIGGICTANCTESVRRIIVTIG